jgi:hypothetical protein
MIPGSDSQTWTNLVKSDTENGGIVPVLGTGIGDITNADTGPPAMNIDANPNSTVRLTVKNSGTVRSITLTSF